MTLVNLSYLLESFFYNGVVKSNSKQLTRDDMLQYIKIAYANVMRNLIITTRAKDIVDSSYLVVGSLLRKEYEVKQINKRKKHIDISKTPIILLPENQHIFSINPINENGCEVGDVIMIQPAESKFYKNDADFDSFIFCEQVGNLIEIYNLPDCISKIEIEAVFDNVDAEIPNDIAADVIKYVLKDMLLIKQISVDKIDDNNPNDFVQELKQKLNFTTTK